MSHERTVRRRVHRSTEEKQTFLAAWEASGLSAREFARREGVTTSCLWRWKRAASGHAPKSAPRPRSSITFAPVHVTKTPPSAVLGTEHVIVEVVLGRDVRVRVLEGSDMEQVTLLIRALAGGVAC